ncbi:MAG: 30S ribosomal protein S5 [Parcubacteria group bacterium GW2011_GWA2_47_16]|nr:MAG: 30S ribosomal protein S5 [Parcubacteria group bacterium GW2011_GWA2_47_16]
MAEETKTENAVTPSTQAVSAAVSQSAPVKDKGAFDPRGRGGFRGGSGNGRPDRKRSREERPRSEFDQKILTIRRVTRVASGGRRFSFSVAIVLGNRKGSVGVGTGKASDTSLAIDKATKNAKKHLLKLSLTKTSSIPYEMRTKYSSARVLIMPAKGRGLIAGSALRDVLDLAGVRDVAGKIFSGSKNKLNIARATVKALTEFTNNQQHTTDNKKTDKDLTVVSG